MDEKDMLLKTIEAQNATMESLSATIREQAERIKELTAQVAYLNRQLFGRKSEKLPIYNPAQLDLFADQFASEMKLAEEKRDEAVAEVEKNTKEERRQRRQNREMLENLPVLKQTIIQPDDIDLNIYKEIGREVTRVVEHEPGKLYIHEIVRIKYGMKDNTQLPPVGRKGVEMAPLPLLPIDKGIAGASLLAEILLQKYEYHMPFYRQIKQFTHLGMKGLKESTIDGWFKKAMELLKPLYLALVEEVMKAGYCQADETTTPVIDK